MSNSINCARRSFETSPAVPVRRFVTCGIVRSFASTPCTVARKVGSATVRVCERTSTASDAGVLKPALARICSARAVSPVDCSDDDNLCVPTVVPSPIATTTKATHTATAVFQCAALHRPARAARLSELMPQTPLCFAVKRDLRYQRKDYSNRAYEVKFRRKPSPLSVLDQPRPRPRLHRCRPGYAPQRRRPHRRHHRKNGGPDRQRARASRLPDQNPRRPPQPIRSPRRASPTPPPTPPPHDR